MCMCAFRSHYFHFTRIHARNARNERYTESIIIMCFLHMKQFLCTFGFYIMSRKWSLLIRFGLVSLAHGQRTNISYPCIILFDDLIFNQPFLCKMRDRDQLCMLAYCAGCVCVCVCLACVCCFVIFHISSFNYNTCLFRFRRLSCSVVVRTTINVHRQTTRNDNNKQNNHKLSEKNTQ